MKFKTLFTIPTAIFLATFVISDGFYLAASDDLLTEEEIKAFRSDLESTKIQMLEKAEASLPDTIERRLKKLAAFEAQSPNSRNKSKVQSIPGATFTEEEVLAMESESESGENTESDQVSSSMSGLKKEPGPEKEVTEKNPVNGESELKPNSSRRTPRLRSR